MSTAPQPLIAAPDATDLALAVDDADLLSWLVETSRRPVVAQFAASSARAGQLVSPELDTLARRTSDWVAVVDVSVDQDPRFQDRFGLVTTPALVLWSDGREVARFDGRRRAGEIERLVTAALGRAEPGAVSPAANATPNVGGARAPGSPGDS